MAGNFSFSKLLIRSLFLASVLKSEILEEIYNYETVFHIF